MHLYIYSHVHTYMYIHTYIHTYIYVYMIVYRYIYICLFLERVPHLGHNIQFRRNEPRDSKIIWAPTDKHATKRSPTTANDKSTKAWNELSKSYTSSHEHEERQPLIVVLYRSLHWARLNNNWGDLHTTPEQQHKCTGPHPGIAPAAVVTNERVPHHPPTRPHT
jgi:hypothetical protein